MWQAVDINYWSLTLIRRQGQEVDVNELHLSCNKLWYIWYACLARLPIPSNFHIFIIYRLRYPDEWKALQLTTSANAKIPLNKSPTWRHNLFRFLQIRKWLLGPPSQLSKPATTMGRHIGKKVWFLWDVNSCYMFVSLIFYASKVFKNNRR